MSDQTSLSTLRAFLDTLEKEMGWEFELHEFDDRLRLQKYIFLAPSFGFEHCYSYGMHLRGPYSPSLAQDYYSDLTSIEPNKESIRLFDVASFVELVENKEVRWLEVAATLRAYVIRLENKETTMDLVETAIQRTVDEKNETRSYVEQVSEELRSAGIVAN
jgi:uncharacterized protein YwgA